MTTADAQQPLQTPAMAQSAANAIALAPALDNLHLSQQHPSHTPSDHPQADGHSDTDTSPTAGRRSLDPSPTPSGAAPSESSSLGSSFSSFASSTQTAPTAPPIASPPSIPSSAPPTQARAAPHPPPHMAVRPQPGRPGAPVRGGMMGPMGMRGQMGMGGGGAPAPMQTRLPPSLQAKMDKLAAQRSGAPSPTAQSGMGGPAPSATSMGALLRQQAMRTAQPAAAGPSAGPLGLAARRAAAGRLNLGAAQRAPASAPAAGGPGGLSARGGIAGRRGPPGGLSLAQMGQAPAEDSSKFMDFKTIMDPSGSLRFSKAVLHSGGVDFGDGQSFKINMDEMDVLGELGKGNYGSVQKVFHRPTGVTMAMKEIRLELDESKLNGIIMELDILHRAIAPEIVEFYGAFTIESCVYYCMEFMDAGSLDKLTGTGRPMEQGNAGLESGLAEGEMLVPEPVLRRITASIVRGLGFLKDELQIMHRDVKPTNVLINRKGEVKLCDFGVSGQLEKSLAKTNIGCQSYMAPERIKGESQNQVSTYTVSSDVWSVGLSIIELAKGCYPYPPETFANVFAQLTAIVNGPAPTLPPGYSDEANDFVAKCLQKDPHARPTYAQMLEHPFLKPDKDADVDMVGWINTALERQAKRGVIPLQAVEG